MIRRKMSFDTMSMNVMRILGGYGLEVILPSFGWEIWSMLDTTKWFEYFGGESQLL